ncbi:spore maturation protein A [Butyricicoccus faecihominis]|uniref:nucleoside recognition domain-containing protein n=1 Tax=Butyricicoccaceae TaxID=3085642 RepID=UPI00247A8A59|nr:nucleoside recognition domain-containing protein [Agathobaculum sp. NTUH-O15-33]MCQ5128685.1 spore maturation protein A [Butyricicoccus faecihominis]WNX85841.1 nucleoside recognition domain-containing protein [Agathobaculum sp. NTUH-O15-33]
MLSVVWVCFLVLSLVCGVATGRLDAVTAAVSTGAAEAVTLAISIAGLMCFWSGLMELISASGLAEKLSRLLMPVLRPLFGAASRDREAMEAVSANVTANLLGLSNAATPLGLKAVDRLYTLEGRRGSPDTVLTLITLNTASIQLIPSTVAAVRGACGSAAPFDIMPAVWVASITSVAAVLISGRLMRPLFPEKNRGK